MLRLLGALLLAVAFLVLVVTFVWIARILALRGRSALAPEPLRPETAATPDEPAALPGAPALGRGYGANYGLVLGLLACGLFWVSPLTLALSFVGAFYSGRALWQGVRICGVFIGRAGVALLLNLASVGLHYWQAVGGGVRLLL